MGVGLSQDSMELADVRWYARDIKPIRTAKDHRWALREIEALWEKAKPMKRPGNPALGT